MVEFSTRGSALQKMATALKRAGALDVDASPFPKSGFSTIDWKMIKDEQGKVFSSSLEIDNDRGITFAEIRLPNFTVKNPTVRGGKTKEEARRSEIIEIWEEIKFKIGNIIDENTDIEVIDGVPQRDDVEIRPQDGFLSANNGQELNVHIQFSAFGGEVGDRTVPITFSQLTKIVEDITEMWREEYFHLDVVERGSIQPQRFG